MTGTHKNPTSVVTIATPSCTPQLEAFTQVVEQRRSVRQFTDTVISDEIMDECLHLAMLAPNSSNLQPWEFYVIESADHRVKANKICMNQSSAKTANKLVAIVARTDTWADNAKRILADYPIKPIPKYVKNYYGKLIPIAFTKGKLVSMAKRGVIGAHRKLKGPVMTPIYNDHQLKNWATNQACLASQNFMLAMRAHGFDTCPIGGFDEPAMKQLLGLSQHQHITMMIACGERAEKGIYGEQYRFADEQFIHRV